MAQEKFHGVGKRKTSVARVWIKPGQGRVVVNGREMDDYFPRDTLKMIINQPFQLTDTEGQFDVMVNVRGGGVSSQADAVRYGLVKALIAYDSSLRPVLKRAGLVTRDARVVERKKYGRKKARKGFQWRKR